MSNSVEIPRSSNLELYRIVCMFAIVAHHYVVNSGLMWDVEEIAPMISNPKSMNTIYLLIFGMWGKTGINCFVMITAYYMCKSTITIHKFLKLLLSIYFYKVLFYIIFLAVGREELSLLRILQIVLPIWGISDDFVSCFLVFFLTIPFWNTLINNISKKQHFILLSLLVGVYSVLGSIPYFPISMNYVVWFGVIYVVGSYLRFYPAPWLESRKLWGVFSICSISLAILSELFWGVYLDRGHFYWVSDSNKILALLVAVSTFNWFRLLQMKHSKFINIVAASTFGVLLIHSNSPVMRQWIWRNVVDCVGHYDAPLISLVQYSIISVLLIFASCIIIDRLRIELFEKPIFKRITNVS